MARTIEGDLPDEEAPLYLLNHVQDECLEDFFLGLLPDDMESLVLLVLVKSLCDDEGSVGLFYRLLYLLEKSAEDELSRKIGKIDYLSDLVKCYRFFYDGMILPHTTKRDLADTFLSGTDVAHALSIDDLRDLVDM